MLLKVNNIEGLCWSFNCDYLYTAPTAVITGQSRSGNRLTITGTGLPTTNISVGLANSVCGSILSASSTQIVCDLTQAPAAGSWDIKLTDPNGLIPVQAGVA